MHNELIFHCEVCDGYVARVDLISHMTHHALFPIIAAASTAEPTDVSPDLPIDPPTNKDAQISLPNAPEAQPAEVNGPPTASLTKEDRATISNGSSKENHSPPKTPVTSQKCTLCDKSFADRTGLRYHTKHVHEKIKNYRCDICDRKFSCKRIILNHIRGVHIKEKSFKCSLCPKTFKIDSALYMHKKSHEDKYLYFCGICDGKFKSRTQLNVHLTMHTKEKNYFCTICNKGFAVRNNLTKHIRTHSNAFDFKCHICNYAANQKRYLQEHMKRAHQTLLPPSSTQ